VELIAVEFDRESLALPVHVELETGDEGVRCWLRKTGFAEELQEPALQPGAGVGGIAMQLHPGAELCDAGMLPGASKQAVDGPWVEKPESLGAVEVPFDSFTSGGCRPVEKRSWHGGRRQPLLDRTILGRKPWQMVDMDPLPAMAAGRDGNLHGLRERGL